MIKPFRKSDLKPVNQERIEAAIEKINKEMQEYSTSLLIGNTLSVEVASDIAEELRNIYKETGDWVINIKQYRNDTFLIFILK